MTLFNGKASQAHGDNPPGCTSNSSMAQPTGSLPQQHFHPCTTPVSNALHTRYSPLTLDEDSIGAFGFAGKDSEDRYNRFFKYARHHFIGPMPVETFLDTFMDRQNIFKKWPQMPVPSSNDAFAGVPKKAEKEKEIYEPLIKSLNLINPEEENSNSRCPGFTFLNTSVNGDLHHGSLGSVKPDVCCYADGYVLKVQTDMDKKAAKRKPKAPPDPSPDPYRGTAVMGYAAMFIEVKTRPSLDPFRDPPPETPASDFSTWQFVLDTPMKSSKTEQNERMGCFGQNIAYATEILARQHRLFLFSICLCGSMARFIRWDRAGAIVTKAFDIHQSSEYLCHFLWLFALMSDGQRGYDLTVGSASPDECEAFEKAILRHAQMQAPPDGGPEPTSKDFVKKALKTHYLSGNVTVVHIPEPNSSVVRKLLVSRPFIYPITAFGKAWRTYWAVDTTLKAGDRHRVVLLKDTWREFPPPSGRSEIEVLQRLRDGVDTVNVPEVLFSGDVRQRDAIPAIDPDNNIVFSIVEDLSKFQTSLTQAFLGEGWVCGAGLNRQSIQTMIREHRHHRLALSTPGATLGNFSGTKELLTATFDVAKTLKAISQKHHIVHRNLSPRSIILYADQHKNAGGRRKGYLIDWDQSWDDRLQLNSAAHYSPGKQPALQFLCARLASGDQMTMHSVNDDLESLLYVILYLAVLWLPLEERDKHAANTIRGMFEDWAVQSGQLIALGKKFNKLTREHTQSLKWRNRSFQDFIDMMLDLLQPLADRDGELPHQRFVEWSIDNVNRYWEDFLNRCEKELPSKDKELHLPNLAEFNPHVPRNIMGEPNYPTISSPSAQGVKRNYRQFISDGAGTSMARHMGNKLILDASNEQCEDESPAKRRRLRFMPKVEPKTVVESEAGPSNLAPVPPLASTTSESAFDDLPHDIDALLQLFFPQPIVALEVHPSDPAP